MNCFCKFKDNFFINFFCPLGEGVVAKTLAAEPKGKAFPFNIQNNLDECILNFHWNANFQHVQGQTLLIFKKLPIILLTLCVLFM